MLAGPARTAGLCRCRVAQSFGGVLLKVTRRRGQDTSTGGSPFYGQTKGFHWLKSMFYFPLLVLKGIYYYEGVSQSEGAVEVVSLWFPLKTMKGHPIC